MELRIALDHVRERVRTYGMTATLQDFAFRAVNHAAFVQIQKGMAVRLTDVRDARLFEAPGLDARFVAEDELRALASHPENQMSPEFLRSAIARGDRCYALFDRGALTAYGWYADRPTPFDEHFTVFFDPAWSYMYKGYTLPAYRGRRLHAVAMCRALRSLSEQGKRGLTACVASNNFASLQSIARMGYRIFGDVYLMRAAGRSLSYASRGCRPYGFRIETADSAVGARGSH